MQQQGSALELHDADREYLATLHTKLHDPSLLQPVPIIPPPPVFFKHTELSMGCESPWDAGGRSPPGAYKLLSSDYAWLADPQKALAAKQKQQLEPPLPEPPAQMQHFRFLSRARTLLVKLRQQIDEVVQGALHQGTQQLMLCLDAELDGGMGMGAAAPSSPTNYTDAARSARGTSNGGGVLLGSANGRPSQGGGVLGLGNIGQGQEALGGAACGEVAADHPIVANMGELGRLAETQLGAMFEDCLSDLMEELWAALQYGGSAHGKVDALANRMAQREKEIEELAYRKLSTVEGELGKVQQELHKTQEALQDERADKLNLVSAFQAKEAQFNATLQSFQDHSLLNQKLQQDIDELKKDLEQLKISRGEQIQAACKELAERNEGLSRIIAGNKAIMHAKDHDMGLLHVRLAEQLTMLDLAFSRREGEVKRTADLEAVLAETMDLLVSEGQNSLDQWATLNVENCVPGALSVPELRSAWP
ncbi:hypothetical protein DUNSADRAFT_14191 [Dunaliella salina]|uniref:Uncharacterized protein n=1 Tax=Dunaliella salina TaxID=3046 RepID=A0ABQ7G7U5_DUNSA|nr:hypothetical protein DUNSADRAFT_14191 [Dunaliella salina]|eukprot:KAF5830676.1 hypothetical protein DUNSADRAFT_14191 [Dunaliella salina]